MSTTVDARLNFVDKKWVFIFTLKHCFCVLLLCTALYSLNKTRLCLHTSCYFLPARLPVDKYVIVL